MTWPLNFISEKDFYNHVKATIEKYGEKLQSFDLKRFNKNIIDPIKLIFDKTVYHNSWDEIIKSEIFRQRDKSNNNDIGYFHQKIFRYIEHCKVPKEGWDVIYKNPKGITLPDGSIVSSIYVEMKNKHNTMNAASSGKTFIKMQNQILKDDDCACFLVEVTGQDDAFYQMCMILPKVIKNVVSELGDSTTPCDTVFEEIIINAEKENVETEELAISMAIYMLGFPTYLGFDNK